MVDNRDPDGLMTELVARLDDREKARRTTLVLRVALAVSVGAHLILGVCMGVHASTAPASGERAALPEDRWTGDSLVESELVEVTLGGPGAPAPPATEPPRSAPSERRESESAEAPSNAVPPEPQTTTAPEPKATIAPEPKPAALPSKPSPSSETGLAAAARAPEPGAPAAAEGGGPERTFGSEGPPQVRELAVAVTRAMPRAGVSNRRWAEQPSGTLGPVEIVFAIDAEGRLTSWRPVSERPPKVMTELLDSVVFTLKSGRFSVGGEAGQAEIALTLEAKIAEVPVPDDHPGGPVSLSFEFEGGVGRASFVQQTGRSVEIAVRIAPTAADTSGLLR